MSEKLHHRARFVVLWYLLTPKFLLPSIILVKNSHKYIADHPPPLWFYHKSSTAYFVDNIGISEIRYFRVLNFKMIQKLHPNETTTE